MSKFTPGPWERKDTICETAITARRPSQPYNFTLAETFGYKEEREANAQLIAAAPELLEALQYVVSWHREHDSGEGEVFGLDYITTSISAITKATGH